MSVEQRTFSRVRHSYLPVSLEQQYTFLRVKRTHLPVSPEQRTFLQVSVVIFFCHYSNGLSYGSSIVIFLCRWGIWGWLLFLRMSTPILRRISTSERDPLVVDCVKFFKKSPPIRWTIRWWNIHCVVTHGDHSTYVRLFGLTTGTYFFLRHLLRQCSLRHTIPKLDYVLLRVGWIMLLMCTLQWSTGYAIDLLLCWDLLVPLMCPNFT